MQVEQLIEEFRVSQQILGLASEDNFYFPIAASLPGNRCVGVWYPTDVPVGSIVLNYSRCLLCKEPMLRIEGEIPICGRELCRKARELKHPAAMQIVCLEDEALPDLKVWSEKQEARELRMKQNGHTSVNPKFYIHQQIPIKRRKERNKVEIEILQLVAEDLSFIQIAEKTGLRMSTCQQYFYSICKKLGKGSKLDAIRMGMSEGLIKISDRQFEILKRSKADHDAEREEIRRVKAIKLVNRQLHIPRVFKRDEYGLTERDRKVLNFLAEGFRIDEIAIKLNISTSYVKVLCKDIYKALDVHSILNAVLTAARKGIIQLNGLSPTQ